MIVTTTDTVQNATVESYLGVVTAEVIYGSNALRDLFAGVRDFIGGRTGSYERLFEKGQEKALKELEQRAEKLGGNAVLGVRVNTDTINVDEEGVLFLITASGTAARLG